MINLLAKIIELRYRLSLAAKIEKAKKLVVIHRVDDLILVTNSEEIINILGYEHSFGIAVFVKSFIANNVCTKKCVDYLMEKRG